MLLLGVDAGGSTTVAALADETGQVLGMGVAGPGNFQTWGLEAARGEVEKSIALALQNAQAKRGEIAAAYFGMAGADRPRDYELVRQLLEPIVPPQASWAFENDAFLGLWAGTKTGVGVGVICGTGTNVVGVNAQGRRLQIGGLGTLFGDYAGGAYIGELAVARSQRGFEGRGTPTILYTLILNHYGINNLLDLVDWIYEDRDLRLAELTPLVVEAAGQGDGVAREILTEVGQELGNSALTAVRRLFHPDESVSVVAMGSVFQKSRDPFMYQAFVQTLESCVYQVEPQILKLEPVAGALYGAAAQIDLAVTEEFTKRMEHSLRLFG